MNARIRELDTPRVRAAASRGRGQASAGDVDRAAASHARGQASAGDVDRAFALMGTTIRLVLCGDDAVERADAAEAFLRDYDARLSRFRADSELSRLNRDPRRRVRCSQLVRDAVSAGLWAAERTGGLVDPTLLDALELAGYEHSFIAGDRLPLDVGAPALIAAPHPDAAWRSIRVHDATSSVVRPPGLRLDLGATGKGRAADLVAQILEGAPSWVVDCGGDIRVGGDARATHAIEVEDPNGGPPLTTLHLESGAVATSSVHARAWRTADGERAHHLLDPRTGRPVRTAITAATAIAPTALQAETLAKAAVLTGETAWLDRWGGVASTATGPSPDPLGDSPPNAISTVVTEVRRVVKGDSPLHLRSTVVTGVRR